MVRAQRHSSVLRAAGAVAALILCAWFAIGIRQARDTARAQAFVTTHKVANANQARAVDSLLAAASLLNPDTTVSLLRGRVASERGNPAEAERIIIPVTRQEPQNLDAWLSLAYVSGTDQKLFFHALAEVKRLDPKAG